MKTVIRKLQMLCLMTLLFTGTVFSVMKVNAEGGVAKIGTVEYDTLADALAHVRNGETITMIGSTSEGTLAYSAGSFILDLNGQEVTIAGITVSGETTLEIKDTAGTGKLKLTGTGESSGLFPGCQNVVHLTVSSGNIESDGVLFSINSNAANGSTITIDGGYIDCQGAVNGAWGRGTIGGNVSLVTINGGTIINHSGQTIRIAESSGHNVVINGGYMKSSLEIVRAAYEVTINGGSLVGNGEVGVGSAGTQELHGTSNHKVHLHGGYYAHDQEKKEDWMDRDVYGCEPDYDNGDNHDDTLYVIKPALVRVSYGSESHKFSDMARALDSIDELNDTEVTMKLIRDPESGLPYALPLGQKLIVQLNGHSDPLLDVYADDGTEIKVTRQGSTIIYERTYTVKYVKGTYGAFDDDIHSGLALGDPTPAFSGTTGADGHPAGTTGYVFAGWDKVISETVSAGDCQEGTTLIVYTATWKEDKNGNGKADDEETFTVIYDPGEHGDFEQIVTEGLIDGISDTPAYSGPLDSHDHPKADAGWVWTGWDHAVSEKVNAGDDLIDDPTPDNIIRYTGQYKPDLNNNGIDDDLDDRFTITYTDGVDGEEIFPDESYPDILVGMPTPAFQGSTDRIGYTFTGWFPELKDYVDGDTTYVATWKAEMVHYNIDSYLEGYEGIYDWDNPEPYNEALDGIYPETYSYRHDRETALTGSPIFVVPSNIFPGYVYDPEKTAELGELGPITVNGDGSSTLKIYYKRIRSDVTYSYRNYVPTTADPSSEGLSAYTLTGVPYGKQITIADPAQAEGYTFSGWSSNNVTPEGNTFIMPAEDVTFTGSFAPITGAVQYEMRYYTLKPNDSGTGTDNGVTVINGHEYELLEDNVKHDYGTATEMAEISDPGFNGYHIDWTDTKASTVNEGATFDDENMKVYKTVMADPITVLAVYLEPDKFDVEYGYRTDSAISPAELIPETKQYRFNDTVTVEPAPAAELMPAGYTFIRWTGSYGIDDNWQFTMPAGNVRLNGSFVANTDTKWKLIHLFEQEDGSESTTYIVHGEENECAGHEYTGTTDTLASYTASEYDGYEYSGESFVSLNGDTETPVADASILGDGTLVVKLHYVRKTYRMTYSFSDPKPAEAALPSPNPVEGLKYAGKVLLDETYEKDSSYYGYTFNGWRAVQQGVDIQTDSEGKEYIMMPAGNVEIIGSWTANTDTRYRVEYYYMDKATGQYPEEATSHEIRTGTTDTTASVTFADLQPDTVTYPDHVLDTDRQENYSGKISGGTMLVLQVYFKAQYTVTYNDGVEDQVVFPDQVKDGLDYDSATPAFSGTPSRPGYDFDAWDPEPEDTVKKDQIYKATWTPRSDTSYTVEFYYQISGAYSDTADYDFLRSNAVTDQLIAVTDNDKYPDEDHQDYVLDEDADNVFEGIATADGKLVLKVYFKQQFTVIYDDGLEDEEILHEVHDGLDYGDPTPACTADIKIRPDYVLTGWQPEWDATVSETVTYTAVWKEDLNNNSTPDEEEYRTITYKDGLNGAVFADETHDRALDGLETPAFAGSLDRDDYVFVRWDPEFADTVDGDKTYTAQWDEDFNHDKIPDGQQEHYTIIFDPQGGTIDGSSEPVEREYVVNQEIRIIGAPVRSGFTFLYWEGSIHHPGETYTVTEDHLFKAIWATIEPYVPPKTGVE